MDDWRHILDEHGPHVWRTICRIVSDTDAARDCYQETFLAAVRHAQRHEVRNWQAMLTTLATRRAIDHLRKRYRNLERHEPGLDPDDIPMRSRGVVADLEDAELRQRVRKHLASLPRRQAQAFWMRHMENLSIAEIAAELRTPPANVSVLVNRATKRLRELLERNSTTPLRISEVTP